MLEELARKLHPDRFSDMSPRMAALVGYLVGEKWTTPVIYSLSITSDGYLLANDDLFIGSVVDFERNLDNLVVAAGLTPAEERALRFKILARVQDWRR